MSDVLEISPIAYICNGYKEKFGIPRQSGLAPSVKSFVEFSRDFQDENIIRDIEQYSHLWLVWGFSENSGDWSATVRPPKLGGNKRVGVFASRSPFRPNPLGLSAVRLESVSKDGAFGLWVSGADLKDGTPVYDIKPYLPYSDSIPDAVGGFSDEHKDDSFKVNFPEAVKNTLPKGDLTELGEILSLDPKPQYQNDPKRIYGLSYKDYTVKFTSNDEEIRVVSVDKGDLGC